MFLFQAFEETAIAYINYLISEKKSLQEPCSHYFRNLLSQVGFSDIPSAEEIEEHLLEKAMSETKAKNFTESILPCLYLQTAFIDKFHDAQEEDTQILFALLMAMNCDQQYCLISYKLFEVDELLQENLEAFCDKYVIEVSVAFEIKIQAVITNYEGDLQTFANFCDENGKDTFYTKYNYIRSQHFYKFLDQLLSFESDEADTEAFRKYGLSELKIKYASEKISLATAVEDVFECICNGLFQINDNAENLVKVYLDPFSIGCNFLSYNYKFKKLQSLNNPGFIKTCDEKLFHFANCLPDKAIEDYGNYKKERQGFVQIFSQSESCSYSSDKFWKVARQECADLSSHARKLLQIPAIPKKVEASLYYNVIKDCSPENEKLVWHELLVLLKNL